MKDAASMQKKQVIPNIRHAQPSSPSDLLLSKLLLTALLRLIRLLLLRTRRLSRLLSSNGLGAVVLAHRLHRWLVFLGLDDGDGVRERLLRAGLAFGVAAAHDLDFDTEDTLAEEDVAGCGVDEVFGGLTGVNHEAVLFAN